jgi:hypothetical protein
MKPLNLDNSPCSPISSNCVIWQGPDISCINLCAGDSVSDVVYKLATELCTIMDQLDLTNLDLSCLKLAPNSPADFSELMQILIDRICAGGTGSTGPAAITDPCPTNCIVPIADCFKTSATQTTMLLLDYVQMIGEKVCSIVDQIDEINNTITNIDNRVTILENKPVPEPYELPPLLVDCTLADDSIEANNSYRLDLVLAALVNDNTHGYCALLSSLGQPGDVFTAYNFQSTTSAGNYVPTIASSPSLFNCGTPMQTEYTSWIATPQNLSDSFINLWITVSDIRKAHKTYDVVAGTNTTVTSATAATACGNKDTFTVNAQKAIVTQGTNTTVTSATVGLETTYTVAAKGVTGLATSSITTTVDSTGSSHVVSARVNDTGWVNLLGFSFYGTDSKANYSPQCRRVGNLVYFRGMVMIPLSSNGSGGGSALSWNYTSSSDTYAGNTSVAPYQTSGGTDAVSVNAAGSVTFNDGASVVPTTVVDGALNFERIVQTNYTTAQRYALVSGGNSVILTSVIKIWITTDKKLVFQYLRDNEYSSGGISSNILYTSPYNILNTIVTSGEHVPNYAPGGISSNAATGTQNLTTDFISNTYLFNCDPSQPGQTGGFGWVSLDGLVASLPPCNTDIKTVTC